jgi:hypothetical protein
VALPRDVTGDMKDICFSVESISLSQDFSRIPRQLSRESGRGMNPFLVPFSMGASLVWLYDIQLDGRPINDFRLYITFCQL